MHSCGGSFLTYRYPYRNIMSGCAGGSKEGHRNLCNWARISKLGGTSYVILTRINIWNVSLNKKLGKTGCNMIALCKAGAFQINSQEAFNSSKFNWSLQLFLIREGRNVITSYWKCQTDPPSMGISLTCSEALCWQESLGYPCCKSLAVIPTFLSLSSFYHLGICGPTSLLGYPVMNSSRLTWVWPHPKTAPWSQRSWSLNWTYLCATFRYFVQVWTGTGLEPVTERCSD